MIQTTLTLVVSPSSMLPASVCCVLRVPPDGFDGDGWLTGEAIAQSCDEGELVSGLVTEVEYLDFTSEYTYDGNDSFFSYVITSIDLVCSLSGNRGDV